MPAQRRCGFEVTRVSKAHDHDEIAIFHLAGTHRVIRRDGHACTVQIAEAVSPAAP